MTGIEALEQDLKKIPEQIRTESDVHIKVEGLSVYYRNHLAISNINIEFLKNKITAIIGPSGCGKSTLLRSINRMNDLIPEATVVGKIYLDGINIYDKAVDPVAVRAIIGMVFQRPNPFPMSIYDNIAFGVKINNLAQTREELDKAVEDALRKAALWDEVKDRLNAHAYELSGGQQQRLCIARALAIKPKVLLLDEPTVSLDPVSTAKIEELLYKLKSELTIIIVTHNMQQAARASDYTAVMMPDERLVGNLIEYGPTKEVFTNPRDKRTEAYISGRMG